MQIQETILNFFTNDLRFLKNGLFAVECKWQYAVWIPKINWTRYKRMKWKKSFSISTYFMEPRYQENTKQFLIWQKNQRDHSVNN